MGLYGETLTQLHTYCNRILYTYLPYIQLLFFYLLLNSSIFKEQLPKQKARQFFVWRAFLSFFPCEFRAWAGKARRDIRLYRLSSRLL